MIKLHVDAVLAVRDGFSGRPVTASAVLCTVDGSPFSPVRKDGGYLVFTGLGSGEHDIVLRSGHFQDERLTVSCSGADCAELVVTLKPGAGYPFGRQVTRLTLKLTRGKPPAGGGHVWLASKLPLSEVKIAQELLEKGARESALFFKGQAASFSLPGNFLLLDGVATELCRLEELSGDTGYFFSSMRHEHKRGRSLYPAQLFTADGQGVIRAVFREPVELEIYDDAGGKSSALKLEPGENEAEFKL